MIVEDDVPVCGGVEESVAFNVKLKLPTADGVPVSAPEEAFSVRPVGREPESTLQVIGDTAPAAATDALYAAPDTASGSVLPVMCKPVATVSASEAVAVCAGEEESATCTVNEALAAAVGTPETVPVAAFKVRPVGSAPPEME